ncbi:TetR/AcrR family transcriptional regulator [Nonomuraea basaltis]|uniref:TetR/AcrR family transcriptional regulator n=1 Tax=Nonomuraea basaltis TaxID=2495887 RepID=UPI0014871A0C|nr:TetR/AcrR family transcriptional regulator [Nonomuraea basaltis]
MQSRLFEAACAVLLREGPGGLSGRAITREAGVATGLLHNHFGDLDGFLAEFIAEGARQAAETATRLRSLVGKGSVAGNLTQAALAFGVYVPAAAELVRSRPALAERLHQALASNLPTLAEIRESFAGYLEAEQVRGRLAADADTGALALALVATAHHLFAMQPPLSPEPQEDFRRVVATLMSGAGSPSMQLPDQGSDVQQVSGHGDAADHGGDREQDEQCLAHRYSSDVGQGLADGQPSGPASGGHSGQGGSSDGGQRPEDESQG